jgi:hypothetical protein
MEGAQVSALLADRTGALVKIELDMDTLPCKTANGTNAAAFSGPAKKRGRPASVSRQIKITCSEASRQNRNESSSAKLKKEPAKNESCRAKLKEMEEDTDQAVGEASKASVPVNVQIKKSANLPSAAGYGEMLGLSLLASNENLVVGALEHGLAGTFHRVWLTVCILH